MEITRGRIYSWVHCQPKPSHLKLENYKEWGEKLLRLINTQKKKETRKKKEQELELEKIERINIL